MIACGPAVVTVSLFPADHKAAKPVKSPTAGYPYSQGGTGNVKENTHLSRRCCSGDSFKFWRLGGLGPGPPPNSITLHLLNLPGRFWRMDTRRLYLPKLLAAPMKCGLTKEVYQN